MNVVKIFYHFYYDDQTEQTYTIELDPHTLEVVDHGEKTSPEWTKLDHNQCSHCPLKKEDHALCPTAKNISIFAENFKNSMSYDQAYVEVTTDERTYSKKTSFQDALKSIFGLVMAASGCPHLSFLKPMARFHLPFSTLEETIVRSTSMYLLGQYFIAKDGKTPDTDLSYLQDLYDQVKKVNEGIVSRIKGISQGDADSNAVNTLQSLTQIMLLAISRDLSKIEPILKHIPAHKD